MVLIGSLAAPLDVVHRPRRGREPDRRHRRRRPRRDPRAPARCSWPSPRTSRSSSRSSRRRSGWPPAGCKGDGRLVRARGAARRPRLARPQRRRSSSALAVGLVVRLGSRAGRGVARRGSRRRLPFWRGRRLRRRCSSSSWGRGGARQLATFGSISPTAVERQRPLAPDDPRVEQHHRRAVARRVPRPGLGPRSSPAALGGLLSRDRQLRGDHLLGRPRAVPARRRVARGAARSTSGRGSCTRSSSSPARRSSIPLHVPGGAFIHSAIGLAAARLHPGARGRRWSSSAGSPGAGRPGTPKAGDPVFVWAVVGFVVADRAALRHRPSHEPGTPAAQPRVALADAAGQPRRRPGRPAAVDRRRRDQVLHRPPRRS